MLRSWFIKVRGFTIGWILAIFIWRLIRQGGFDTYFNVIDKEATLLEYFLIILSIAVVAGLIFGSLQFAYERLSVKSISFQLYALWALLSHLFLMIALWLIVLVGSYLIGLSSTLDLKASFADPIVLVSIVFFFLVNGMVVITFQLERLLGKGNLSRLITGRFHMPKEESRVFMFLDLKGSTSIAEQLGHLKYSKFIQDCFHHLAVTDSFGASIYQYVGDEVVLTWKIGDDQTLENCIYAFYAYTDTLEANTAYYKSEYGVLPIFKGGIHLGPITVVEVGNLKREIAYHGDTINVASRIQEQCKVFDRSLLCSHEVYARFKDLHGYIAEEVGDFTLRGKKEPNKLYAISQAKQVN